MSIPSPYDVNLPGWVSTGIPWSVTLLNPADPTLPAWSALDTYAAAAIVLYGGAPWQAVTAVLGEAPGVTPGNWLLLPGTPIDVSGWTVMHTVKANYTDPDSAAVYISDKVMPGGSTNGVISGELPASITDGLTPFSYPFDTRVIVPPNPEPQMLFQGKYQLFKSVGNRLVPNLAWAPL